MWPVSKSNKGVFFTNSNFKFRSVYDVMPTIIGAPVISCSPPVSDIIPHSTSTIYEHFELDETGLKYDVVGILSDDKR